MTVFLCDQERKGWVELEQKTQNTAATINQSNTLMYLRALCSDIVTFFADAIICTNSTYCPQNGSELVKWDDMWYKDIRSSDPVESWVHRMCWVGMEPSGSSSATPGPPKNPWMHLRALSKRSWNSTRLGVVTCSLGSLFPLIQTQWICEWTVSNAD